MPKKKAMKKKQGRTTRAATARTSAPYQRAGFQAGDPVRVLAGDYGNAHGTVVENAGGKVRVQLASESHGEPREFDAENLVRGGANDRV